MSFWNSGLIKNLEDGKLPTVDTEVSFDIEAIAKIVVIVILAIILIFFMYKLILKT